MAESLSGSEVLKTTSECPAECSRSERVAALRLICPHGGIARALVRNGWVLFCRRENGTDRL